MNILVTNDDGFQAPGIRALAHALAELGRVVVVAPDRERSATGHAITMHKPLRVHEVDLGAGIEAYHVNGTPSDCVKLGVEALMGERPDLVFSGINNGGNLGTDVLYSGTVSGAVEGAIQGIPSAALSLVTGAVEDYSGAAAFARQLAVRMARHGLPPDTLLNVNVPGIPPEEIEGVRVTRLSIRRYRDLFHRRTDPRGQVYYWMAGLAVDLDASPDTDSAAVRDGFISITPIHFDLTHMELLDELRGWGWDDKGGAADV